MFLKYGVLSKRLLLQSKPPRLVQNRRRSTQVDQRVRMQDEYSQQVSYSEELHDRRRETEFLDGEQTGIKMELCIC